MKLDECFSWWDYCLPYHVRPHLICETWSPKIEKILSDKFGYSTHRPAQMPFYILLHISNMNQTKLGQRNKPFTKSELLIIVRVGASSLSRIWERNCEKKRCTLLVFIQVKENLELLFFRLFFHCFYTTINVIKTVLKCVSPFFRKRSRVKIRPSQFSKCQTSEKKMHF